MAFVATGESARFTIQDPAEIVLDDPNSGSFQWGSVITLEWSKTNFTSNINSYYTSNTTFSTSNVISSNTSGTTFDWTVPSSLSGDSIYVWVAKADQTSVNDRSNSAISITSQTHTPTLTDTLSLADVPTKTESIWRTLHTKTIADTLSLADVPTKTESVWRRYFTPTFTDSIGLADAPTKTESVWRTYYYQTFPEALGITDVPTKTESVWRTYYYQTFPEVLGVADAPTKTESVWRTYHYQIFPEVLGVADVPTKIERVWHLLLTFTDALALEDTPSNQLGADLLDSFTLSDSWAKVVASPSTAYLMDSDNSTESIKAIRKTGWIMTKDLSNNSLLRRLNIDYTSDSDLTAKVYADDDLDNPILTKTFTASSTPTHGSIRLGTRVKYFLISIETIQSANDDVRIDRIEIEVDD